MRHTNRGFAPMVAVLFVAALVIGGMYVGKVGPFNGADSSAAVVTSSTTSSVPVPTNLDVFDGSTSSVPSSSDKICLTWKGGSGQAEYSIERSTDGGVTWTEIKRISLAQFQVDKGICDNGPHVPDVQKWYRVKAINGGTSSLPSNIDSAWVSKGISPKPASITARLANGGVLVQFPDPSRNETGFEIERTGGGAAKRISLKSNDLGTVDYTDTDVVAGTTYTYKARTKNTRGFSGFSDSVTITFTSVAAATPTAPAPTALKEIGLTAKITKSWLGAKRVDLQWNNIFSSAEVPVSSYEIRMSKYGAEISNSKKQEVKEFYDNLVKTDHLNNNLSGLVKKVEGSALTYRYGSVPVNQSQYFIVIARDRNGKVVGISNVSAVRD